MFPQQFVHIWTEMKFLTFSKDLPIFDSHFLGRGSVSLWRVQNSLRLFEVPPANCKNSFHIKHGNSTLKGTSSIALGYSLTWTWSIQIPRTVCLLFHASVFLSSSKNPNTPNHWKEPQRDPMDSSNFDKEINSLGPEDNAGKHWVQSMTCLSSSGNSLESLKWTVSFIFYFSFSHMCIHSLGRLSLIPPAPSLSHPSSFTSTQSVLPLSLILLKRKHKQ
jgi:hypothetical protein